MPGLGGTSSERVGNSQLRSREPASVHVVNSSEICLPSGFAHHPPKILSALRSERPLMQIFVITTVGRDIVLNVDPTDPSKQ
jgi:hypothetical protein